MTIKGLDAWITGENDPNATFNQPEPEYRHDEIWECLDSEDYERAYELLSELRKEVNKLRDYAKNSALRENQHLLKQLNEIYNLL